MTATYLGLDFTKNYATFLVGAFRKIYLPIDEVRYLTDQELNERLTLACAGFTNKFINLK